MHVKDTECELARRNCFSYLNIRNFLNSGALIKLNLEYAGAVS